MKRGVRGLQEKGGVIMGCKGCLLTSKQQEKCLAKGLMLCLGEEYTEAQMFGRSKKLKVMGKSNITPPKKKRR